MLKKADIILLSTLCLLGIVLTIIIYAPSRSDGTHVVIRQNGKVVKETPLSQNQEIRIGSSGVIDENSSRQEKQPAENIIYISNREIYMKSANCPDKSCVSQGKIHLVGESIICLPHKISIEITDENADTEIDGVSQ